MTKHLGFLTLVFGLVSSSVFAAEGTFSNIHQQYQSIRAAGMGGAFSAVANDYTAMFYNPAAFARFTEGQMQLAPVDLTLTPSFIDFYNDITKIQGSGASQFTNIANTLNRYYGNQYQVRMKLIEMFWARPNWGIGFIPADVTMDFAIQNQGLPALDIRLYADTTFGYSYAKNFVNESLGLLSWGVTTKAILREYASKELNAIDLATSSSSVSSSDLMDGMTADVDLGLLYNPYFPEGTFGDIMRKARPTFSLVGRNLLDGGFGTRVLKISKTQAGTPEKLFRVFDVGARFEIPKFWIFGGRFAIDERDINHPLFNWKKGTHLGFEFDWTMSSWWKGQWRAGYGQGFFSAGFSALFSVFRLDLATFAEDVGSYDNPKENRMYQIKLVGEL